MPLESFPNAFAIVGTDTNIGKTVIASILTMGLKGVYFKPIQCGYDQQSDAEWVAEATGLGSEHFAPEVYRFSTPASPHYAASIDGMRIGLKQMSLPKVPAGKHLIVEGAGGLLVPINEKDFMIDFFAYNKLPVILVARTCLGTLNHTLLSIEALKKWKVDILGVVMNGPSHRNNKESVEHYGQVPVIAEVEEMSSFAPDNLEKVFDQRFCVREAV